MQIDISDKSKMYILNNDISHIKSDNNLQVGNGARNLEQTPHRCQLHQFRLDHQHIDQHFSESRGTRLCDIFRVVSLCISVHSHPSTTETTYLQYCNNHNIQSDTVTIHPSNVQYHSMGLEAQSARQDERN